MEISKKALAENLNQARKNSGLSQQEVADYLKIPRSGVSQIEGSIREVSALELAKLSDLYGYKVSDFFTSDFQENEVSVLLRALPETKEEEQTKGEIKEAVNIIREIINLREILDLKMIKCLLPQYPVKPLKSKWDSVLEGKDLARHERQRLGLGIAPVEDLPSLMEKEGLMVVELSLPREVSGLSFKFKNSVVCGVNSEHLYQRKRFSLAHEYCHSLCDLNIEPIIKSLTGNQKDLEEIRANAFAAEFLMPQEGIKNYIASLGKGYPARPSERVFCEGSDRGAFVEGRFSPQSQKIDLWDVNRVAKYFHVSKESVLWQLLNLKIITDKEREEMLEQLNTKQGKQISRWVGDGSNVIERESYRSVYIHLLHLASVALKRDKISQNKFLELAGLAKVTSDEACDFIED